MPHNKKTFSRAHGNGISGAYFLIILADTFSGKRTTLGSYSMIFEKADDIRWFVSTNYYSNPYIPQFLHDHYRWLQWDRFTNASQ